MDGNKTSHKEVVRSKWDVKWWLIVINSIVTLGNAFPVLLSADNVRTCIYTKVKAIWHEWSISILSHSQYSWRYTPLTITISLHYHHFSFFWLGIFFFLLFAVRPPQLASCLHLQVCLELFCEPSTKPLLTHCPSLKCHLTLLLSLVTLFNPFEFFQKGFVCWAFLYYPSLCTKLPQI